MRRTRKTVGSHEELAPISAEILDQLVKQGPLTADRRRGHQTAVSRVAQYHRVLDARRDLVEARAESICDPLRRAIYGTRGRRMTRRMDAAGPVDAQNAPTGPWKTAQTAVSHSAHTHRPFDRLTHEIPDTP